MVTMMQLLALLMGGKGMSAALHVAVGVIRVQTLSAVNNKKTRSEKCDVTIHLTRKGHILVRQTKI